MCDIQPGTAYATNRWRRCRNVRVCARAERAGVRDRLVGRRRSRREWSRETTREVITRVDVAAGLHYIYTCILLLLLLLLLCNGPVRAFSSRGRCGGGGAILRIEPHFLSGGGGGSTCATIWRTCQSNGPPLPVPLTGSSLKRRSLNIDDDGISRFFSNTYPYTVRTLRNMFKI